MDCFAETKYQGNQLAVFIPDREVSDIEMQQIANEIGFSETSFILSDRKIDDSYDVRIFTPAVEVPFAGHPVLGTAYIIHHILERHKTERVFLNLKVGRILVEAKENVITMIQNEPEFGEVMQKKAVIKALSILEEDVRDDYPVQWVSTGLEAVIVPLKSIEAVGRCHVNYDERQRFIDEHYQCNILVFAEEGNGLRVRVFMDDPGFLEDPATGSANGCLAGYLLKYNFFCSQDIKYQVKQGIEIGRPSKLSVEASLLDGGYTIKVGGRVCIVAEGDWK